MHSKSWLITGASGGLGLSLALHLLKQGKRVLAATRDPSKARVAAPELEQHGGTWLTLDVNSSSARSVVSVAVQSHAVDVLVNNAAYPALGAIEDFDDAEFAASFNTNVFGPQRCIAGAMPHFRARPKGSTAFVTISSGAGIWASAGRGPYAATKHAVSGMSAALADDAKPWGVRVVLAELGAFRTAFGKSRVAPAKALEENGGNGYTSAPYVGTPAHTNNTAMQYYVHQAPGDVERAAKVLADAVDGDMWAEGQTFMRLPLGSDAVRVVEMKIKSLQEQLDAVREVCLSTDYPKEEVEGK